MAQQAWVATFQSPLADLLLDLLVVLPWLVPGFQHEGHSLGHRLAEP